MNQEEEKSKPIDRNAKLVFLASYLSEDDFEFLQKKLVEWKIITSDCSCCSFLDIAVFANDHPYFFESLTGFTHWLSMEFKKYGLVIANIPEELIKAARKRLAEID